MNTDNLEIHSTRLLDAPRERVFRALTTPEHLSQWWGPKAFANTFHGFDFKPGGHWRFTMHGPDGTDYTNENVFAEIVENERLVLDHVVAPIFRMTAMLSDEAGKTRLAWTMRFETAEVCAALRPICEPANEENFDRLEVVLARMAPESRELGFTRILDAPREKVFRCWTEPEMITQWFTPPPYETIAAEIDLRPGGASLITMRAPDGTEMPNPGVYLDVVPNERLVFTDAFVRAWELSEKPFMTGHLTFEDFPGKRTKYTVRILHWSPEDRAAHEEMGFHQGWGIATDQLAALAAKI